MSTEIPDSIIAKLSDPHNEMRSLRLATLSGKWEACIEFSYGVLLHGGSAATPTEALNQLVKQLERHQ